jgi:hypothetical protein
LSENSLSATATDYSPVLVGWDSSFGHHFAKLKAIAQDRSLWPEAAEGPDEMAVHWAEHTLVRLAQDSLTPSCVVASAEGGLLFASPKVIITPISNALTTVRSLVQALVELADRWSGKFLRTRLALRARLLRFVHFSPHRRPARMITGNRGVRDDFLGHHRLYYRCKKEDLLAETGRLSPARIKCENTSVNWSRFSKPWDVICDHPDHGIVFFKMGKFPPDLPKQTPLDPKTARRSFRPVHDPLPANYAHAEIQTFDGNRTIPKPNLSQMVKTEYRVALSDQGFLILTPEI